MDDNYQKIKGEVLENLPNTMFKVVLDDGRNVISTLKGSLRKSYVRIFPGDIVIVMMTKYDDQRGRIVQKLNKKDKYES